MQRDCVTRVIEVKKPLAVRLIHWSVVLLIGISFVIGYVAFDFQLSMGIWVRDALFALHRACGLIRVVILGWRPTQLGLPEDFNSGQPRDQDGW